MRQKTKVEHKSAYETLSSITQIETRRSTVNVKSGCSIEKPISISPEVNLLLCQFLLLIFQFSLWLRKTPRKQLIREQSIGTVNSHQLQIHIFIYFISDITAACVVNVHLFVYIVRSVCVFFLVHALLLSFSDSLLDPKIQQQQPQPQPQPQP